MADNIYFAVKDELVSYRIRQLISERNLHSEVERDIRRLERAIRIEIADYDKRSKRELLVLLLFLVNDHFKDIKSKILSRMERISRGNAVRLHKIMQEAIKPTGLQLESLTLEEVDDIAKSPDKGYELSERLDSVEREFATSIRALVNSTSAAEFDFPFELAALATASRRAQREAAMRVANQFTNIMSQTSLQYAQRNSQYVRFVKFVAILDSRTSQICRKFSGRVFDLIKDKGRIPIPKLHPNCRSELVPVFDVASFDLDEDTTTELGDYLDFDINENESLVEWMKRTGRNPKI